MQPPRNSTRARCSASMPGWTGASVTSSSSVRVSVLGLEFCIMLMMATLQSSCRWPSTATTRRTRHSLGGCSAQRTRILLGTWPRCVADLISSSVSAGILESSRISFYGLPKRGRYSFLTFLRLSWLAGLGTRIHLPPSPALYKFYADHSFYSLRSAGTRYESTSFRPAVTDALFLSMRT
jgi:hypothetical protein